MTATRYLTFLENDGTAVPLGIHEDAPLDISSEVEAAATIDLRVLETRGDLVLKFEVGGRHGSQLFAANLSGVIEKLIADNQTEDGRFPDPQDTTNSLELLARRLELEASLLRSKLANVMFDARAAEPGEDDPRQL